MDQNIINFLACVFFLFLIGRVLKLVFNSILGGGLIYVINIIGSSFGFHIGLNLVTSITVGILGIPGAIALILIKLLIG